MIKMGGMICDMCRTIIRDGNAMYERHTKKGRVMHFCSDKCKDKDTTPGLLKADLGPDASKNYKKTLFEEN